MASVGGQKEKMRMAKNGRQMRIEKCGWQNADVVKYQWKVTNDHIRMMKYDLRCSMTVPVVNKPGHPIEFRP